MLTPVAGVGLGIGTLGQPEPGGREDEMEPSSLLSESAGPGAADRPVGAMSASSGSGVPDPGLTSDEEDFVSMLRPGDVLLFDSARPLSGLIKFGENRPVNHSGIYLGNGHFAEATSHAENGAVRQSDLGDHLRSRRQRTVTAFRHRDAGGRSMDPILERAQFYLESDTSYAYRSLYRLILPSLYRSYRPRGNGEESGDFEQRKSQHWLAILNSLSQSSLSIWEGEDPETGKPGSDESSGLTCSEFVFRCYSEAETDDPVKPLCIDVVEPLTRIRQPPDRPTVRGADVGDHIGLMLHDSIVLESDPRYPITRGRGEPGAGDVWGEMARIAGRALETTVKRKLLSLLGRTPPGPGGSWVVPDTVTPRDLWSSPSLQAFAVFHRPPGPADNALEDEL